MRNRRQIQIHLAFIYSCSRSLGICRLRFIYGHKAPTHITKWMNGKPLYSIIKWPFVFGAKTRWNRLLGDQLRAKWNWCIKKANANTMDRIHDMEFSWTTTGQSVGRVENERRIQQSVGATRDSRMTKQFFIPNFIAFFLLFYWHYYGTNSRTLFLLLLLRPMAARP